MPAFDSATADPTASSDDSVAPAVTAPAPSDSSTSRPDPTATRMAQRRAMEQHRVRRAMRAAGAFVVVVVLGVAASGAVHVVEPGETLSEIAGQHGISTSELAAANGIGNVNLILIGQELTIPGSQRTHTVAYGDFLAGIAASYDTTVQAIVDANALSNPNRIIVGQVLIIPDAGTAQGPAPLVHVVQRGESLASIAAKYGLSVAELAAANGMTVTSIIYEGTQLRLEPATDQPFTPDAGSGVHVVARGETLGGIAARYGTTVSHLVSVNRISNPNRIRVGQTLTVPAGGFVCPVPGSRFFNDWGFPRSGGRFHEGNDLFAVRGAPVLAPVAGVVEQVSGTIGGLQFWLEGDDGNLYIGTHMNSFVGSDGRVAAGQQIGTVGDSGNARGARPHLHFEVLVGGHTNINPYPTLVDACR